MKATRAIEDSYPSTARYIHRSVARDMGQLRPGEKANPFEMAFTNWDRAFKTDAGALVYRAFGDKDWPYVLDTRLAGEDDRSIYDNQEAGEFIFVSSTLAE